MHSDPTLVETHRRVRHEAWAWLLSMVVLAALLLWWALASRANTESRERDRLAVQVRAVEQNLARNIQGAQAALQFLRDETARESAAHPVASFTAHMQALRSAMPGVRSLQWLDASGNVLASSRAEEVGQDQSARAYFRALRGSTETSMLAVSEPHMGSPGVYSLQLSMVVPAPMGGWGGLVTATLDPDFFGAVLSSVRYADDMWAVVAHGRGGVLVSSPAGAAAQGLNVAQPGTPFTRHIDSGLAESVMVGMTLERGEERLFAQRSLQPPELHMDTPLVLAVSRNLDAVFEAWRRQFGVLAAAYLVLLFSSWRILRLLQGRRHEMERLAAERAARQTAHAEQLALALRGADLALWDAKPPGGRSSVNDRWFTIIGLRPGEIVPDNEAWESRLHPDDKAQVLAAQQLHLQGQTESFEATYRLRHADGHWVWIFDRGRVVERDAQGVPLRMVGTHMDVSLSMRAQEALRRSEESLSITLMSIGDAVIATDELGRVARMNGMAEKLTGWSVAEALGRPLADVFCARAQPDGTPSADPVARVLEQGQTVGLANGTMLMSRSGQQHRIADSAAPIRAASGEIVGVVLVFTDVTEQFQMVQALRDREAQLSSMADSLPGPVARLDREGRYLFVNAAYERWFGLRPADMLGRLRQEVPSDAVLAHLAPQFEQVLAGETLSLDCTVPTLLGPREAMVALVPDRDAQGVVQGSFVVATDITVRKQAEDALRLSEHKSRGLLDALRSGVLVHAPDGQVLDANPSACRILGQCLEHLRGRPASGQTWRFLEEDGTPMPLARYPVNQVLASGEPLRNLVVGVQQIDGTGPVWALCNAFMLRGASGALLEVVVTLADFTERKLTVEALRRSEARWRLAGRLAQMGGWSFAGPAGPLEFSLELGQILGAGALQPLAPEEGLQLLPAPMWQLWQERILACLQGGPAFDEEIQAFTVQGQSLYLRVLGEGVRDRSGQLVAVQGAAQDITEHKLAEATLRAAQEELAATLAAVPDLLFDLDLEGRIHNQHSPPSDLLLLSPREFLGRTIEEVLPAGAATVVATAIQQAHATGYSAGLQYELDVRGGRRWFDLSVSRREVPGAELPRFVVLARDVTQSKQAESDRLALERQLREAQKMESIGTLAGGIAHDFNNILAAILGNVALAREDLAPAHPAQLSLDQIRRAGMRARSLVQQILTFSRRQPNQLVGQPLRPVVEETVALLRATLPAWVRLQTVLPDVPVQVQADATQLQQVVMNLCTNAWHALPEGRGHIEVGLAALSAQTSRGLGLPELPAGPCAHLWVRDTGCGMDAALVERIFDPFFTTKPVGHGTGLGLSVVHGIVRAHQGVVQVNSAPGQGSTFHVYLPALDEERGIEPAGSSGEGSGAAGVGQHVIYVDDDEVMVLMVRRLLQRAGYQVTACSTPLQVLALLRDPQQAADLLVSDYNMPEMSGLELTQELAHLRPGLPVIISSGFMSDELVAQAQAMGVRALLKKENTLEELAGLVQQVLAGGGQHKPRF